MNDQFLPVFSVDWAGLLKKLEKVQGDYGILAPFHVYNALLHRIREFNKPFFIDSGVFESKDKPWYYQLHSEFKQDRWVREYRLASEENLRQKIRYYLDRCTLFSPDYVFAPDVIEEPILSLYLARLTREEYQSKPRPYRLIGVVQTGYILYNSTMLPMPYQNSIFPHYSTPKSLIASLISEYRNIGYDYIALGGLLKAEPTAPIGLKFGLSVQELDDLLAWARPNFVLGGLALTRLEVLKKHRVWADSTNWLWWDARYDPQRFGHRDALQEVVGST
ncbi:hypothetical protein V0288_14305 [Pannus brasiliensis CCIBt3594]|uniref:Uncharacterized protein n=1 Tax=Pannus brasiliensis CCIBt3594 TaxID=1427578 RepID=A0AAW9QMJ5_9CHRO